MFALVTSQISALATEQAVTSTLATGGVCCPIAKFKVTIIPKWTGSIPTAFTRGITIGTVKIIAASDWRKKPIIYKNTFKIKRTANLFLVNSIIGLGGFIDVASKIGLERHEEDFGQTLAVWGVGQGPYIMLPGLGP